MKIRLNESFYNDETEMYPGDSDYMGDYNERRKMRMPKDCIKGATLLSEEQYESMPDEDLKIGRSYWLKSYQGCGEYANDAMCADEHGWFSLSASNRDCGVRPVLVVNVAKSGFDIGDCFEFGGYTFKIFSREAALCKDYIAETFYCDCWSDDCETGDYETSDVKKYVDDWFNEAYASYDKTNIRTGGSNHSNEHPKFVKDSHGYYSKDLLDFVLNCPEIDKDEYFITNDEYGTDIYIDCSYDELLGIDASDEATTGVVEIEDELNCDWISLSDDEIEKLEQEKARMNPDCWYMALSIRK